MGDKVPLILYSGGVDSTHLVLERLKQSEVDLLVITSIGINRDSHRQAEAQARQRFYKAASDWYKNSAIENKIRKVINVELPYGFAHHEFSQPPIWITTAFNYADRHLHSSVEMAYVTGDQFAYFAKDTQRAWEMLWQAFNPGINPVVPLKFPFLEQAKDKEWIMQNWDEFHYSLVWYCENPLTVDGTEFYVCDHCPSCKRMRFSDLHKNAAAKGKPARNLIVMKKE